MNGDFKATWDAIMKAKEAFYKSLEKQGYDGAYWELSIDVNIISIDFDDVLEHFHWDNKEHKNRF